MVFSGDFVTHLVLQSLLMLVKEYFFPPISSVVWYLLAVREAAAVIHQAVFSPGQKRFAHRLFLGCRWGTNGRYYSLFLRLPLTLCLHPKYGIHARKFLAWRSPP